MQHVVEITTTKLSKIYYVFGNKYTACISNIYFENEHLSANTGIVINHCELREYDMSKPIWS